MNPLDRWREILEVLWRRKLRTMLTALSVSWGIFMLVILLGAGKGLSNGAEQEFARDAMNTVWVNPGRLSKPYQGQPIGKKVQFGNEDHDLARANIPIVEDSSAVYEVSTPLTIRRRDRSTSFEVRGVQPQYQHIEKTHMTGGRYLNDTDQAERRKVAVIGAKVKEALFGPGDVPVGDTLQIGNIHFTVVGMFEEVDEQNEDQIIYIPLSTAQTVYPGTAGTGRINKFMFTVGNATARQSQGAIDDLTQTLARRHFFLPEDKSALRVWNSQEMQERFNGLFAGIRSFIWVIGLGTIVAGVVGVSNIMLISVKERTREIGIRKAIGAAPASIVGMILEEALLLTLVSGYIGLVAGVATLEAAKRFIPPTAFFRQPDVDLRVGLGATAVLVLAGVVAGLIPALRAARINPIAALRVE